MQFGFEFEAAKPKKQADPDNAPSTAPMKPLGGIRRNQTTTDERKVKRQIHMQRRTASTKVADQPIELGNGDEMDGANTDIRGNDAVDPNTRTMDMLGMADPIQNSVNKETSNVDTLASLAKREAEILAAMHKVTLAQQQDLAYELDSLRERRASLIQQERDIDFAQAIVRDTITPVATHTMHTEATDWLDKIALDSSDDRTVANKMNAEAMVWFRGVHLAVVQDADEFTEQALGMARRAASGYVDRDAAENYFLEAAAHYRKQALKGEAVKAAATEFPPVGTKRRVRLPYSEVCMSMGVAGKEMLSEYVGNHMVQLLQDDGRPFSFPITYGEAGWYQSENFVEARKTAADEDEGSGHCPSCNAQIGSGFCDACLLNDKGQHAFKSDDGKDWVGKSKESSRTVINPNPKGDEWLFTAAEETKQVLPGPNPDNPAYSKAPWHFNPEWIKDHPDEVIEEKRAKIASGETCRHCGRPIVQDGRTGKWVDPEAKGDDSIWRETCDSHDTFTAEHEPENRTAARRTAAEGDAPTDGTPIADDSGQATSPLPSPEHDRTPFDTMTLPEFTPRSDTENPASAGPLTRMSHQVQAAMPDVDQIMRFEQGDMDEDEMIEFFQGLIDSGIVWQLQGFYGRTARDLIEAGLCHQASKRSAYNPLAPCPTCGETGGDHKPGCAASGPKSGVPKDLFPGGGVPLRGDLTPEQEKWLKSRSSKTANDGSQYGGEESWDTGEVELWIANDPGLYSMFAGREPDEDELREVCSDIDGIDPSNVNWGAVAQFCVEASKHRASLQNWAALSRQHYQAIADIVKAHRAKYGDEAANDLAEALAAYFAGDNAAFDQGRFMQATSSIIASIQRRASDPIVDDSGQGVSGLPQTPTLGNDPEPAFDDASFEDAGEGGDGAADVASVPTPGSSEADYPQPKAGSLEAKRIAFRDLVQGNRDRLPFGEASVKTADKYEPQPPPAPEYLNHDFMGNWDSWDPWGSGMIWLGAIADVLQILDSSSIPSEWGYRPAMGLQSEDDLAYNDSSGENYEQSMILEALQGGHVTQAELAAWGVALDKYLDQVRADGRDY